MSITEIEVINVSLAIPAGHILMKVYQRNTHTGKRNFCFQINYPRREAIETKETKAFDADGCFCVIPPQKVIVETDVTPEQIRQFVEEEEGPYNTKKFDILKHNCVDAAEKLLTDCCGIELPQKEVLSAICCCLFLPKKYLIGANTPDQLMSRLHAFNSSKREEEKQPLLQKPN